MPAWHRTFISLIGAWLPTLLTLAALGALAWWGAANHWKLPALHDAKEADSAADKPEPKNEMTAAAQSNRVELASAEAVQKAGLQTAKVQVHPIVQYVRALAVVDYEPSRYARLSTRASGSVWRVLKEIGEPIHKGEALALIESAEVGKLKGSFLQSLMQLRQNEIAHKRQQSLGQEGATSERSQIDAAFAVKEAQIRVFNDQQALLNLGLPIRLEEVKKLTEEQLVQHLRLLGLPADLLEEVDPRTFTANLLPLTAPFDGQVVQRNVGPGEVVQAVETKTGTESRPLFIVADLRRVHIDMDIQPADMARIRLGQKVRFKPDGSDKEAFVSRVSHISPEINDKTRRVQVHSELDNKEGELRPNLFGTAEIVVGEQPHALVVPREALQWNGSTYLVFVKESPTSFAARRVERGLRQENLVEVSGVQEGEEVVTVGSQKLKAALFKDRIAGGD